MGATVLYLFPSVDGILVIAMLGVDAFGDRPQPTSTRNGASRNACLHALTVLACGNMENSSSMRNQPLLTTLGNTQWNKTDCSSPLDWLPVYSPNLVDTLKRIG